MRILRRVARLVLVGVMGVAVAAPARAGDAAEQLTERMLGDDAVAAVRLDLELEAWKQRRVAWLAGEMRSWCERSGTPAPSIREADAEVLFDRFQRLHLAEWRALTGVDRLPETLREKVGRDELERVLAYVSSPSGAPALEAWHRFHKTTLLGTFDDLLIRSMLLSRLRSSGSSGEAEHDELLGLLDAHQTRTAKEFRESIAAGRGQPLLTIEWMQFMNRFSTLLREHGQASLQRIDLATWNPMRPFVTLKSAMTEACTATH
jgi:hypothetical protein